MGRFSRLQVWQTIERSGLVPLYYHADVGMAKRIAEALADGGASVIEFANRGKRAFQVFREVVVHMDQVAPDVILGIGSVRDVPTAGLYINQGANFVVSPATHEDVARLCNRLRIAYFPGCGTATEISIAEELGVEICKVFPGSLVGGPAFIRAIMGPCPQSKLMPTGGVEASLESLQEWFDAGAVCVGIGGSLVCSDLVESEDWKGIAELTAKCLRWIAEIRTEAAVIAHEQQVP